MAIKVLYEFVFSPRVAHQIYLTVIAIIKIFAIDLPSGHFLAATIFFHNTILEGLKLLNSWAVLD